MKAQHIHRFVTFVYLCLFLALWGCSENSLTFQVRFPEVSGLKQGDPVYFDNNEIGKVKKVSYTDQGDYLIEVNIAPGFKNAATDDSRFIIEHSPDGKPHMAVIVEQDRPGGVVLKNGSVVQGSTRKGYLEDVLGDLQKTAGEAQKQLNSALQELKKSLGANSGKLNSELQATLDDLLARFNAFADELGKVPNSEEIKQLEEVFNRFADEFQKARKEVQDHLRNEILPRLRLELERLRKQLKKEGREEELEKIDSEVKDLYKV
jgi:ABC-type transporter Mla subunit MlaD